MSWEEGWRRMSYDFLEMGSERTGDNISSSATELEVNQGVNLEERKK